MDLNGWNGSEEDRLKWNRISENGLGRELKIEWTEMK